MPSKSYSAITFDVGGTLIEPWPSVGQVYADVAAELGHARLAGDILTARFIGAWRQQTAFDYSRAGWAKIVEATFTDLIATPACPTLFNTIYERFTQPQVWRIYEDVVPTLRELRARGFKLAALSNWDERLRPLLHVLGLAEYFPVIVVSGEFGSHKPEPAIYAEAARLLELPPGQILHIGDGRREDWEGAQQAGFAAYWLNRTAATADEHTLTRLDDLPGRICRQNELGGVT